MRWACWTAGLMLGIAGGCDVTKQERIQAYNDLGIDLFQKSDFLDAKDSFAMALKLKPGDPGLLYNRGECYARLNNQKKAEDDYRACLTAAPDHPQARHALVVLLVRTKHEAEARNLAADWIIKEPNRASGYIEAGWLLRHDGNLPQAETRLQQALDLEPNNQYALTELALTFETLKRTDRALVLYEKILEHKPGQPELVNHVNFLLASGAKRPHPE